MEPRESQKPQVIFRRCLQYPPLLAVGIDLQLKNEIFSYFMTENEAKYVGVFKNIDLKKSPLKPYQKKSFQFFIKPLRTSLENDARVYFMNNLFKKLIKCSIRLIYVRFLCLSVFVSKNMIGCD